MLLRREKKKIKLLKEITIFDTIHPIQNQIQSNSIDITGGKNWNIFFLWIQMLPDQQQIQSQYISYYILIKIKMESNFNSKTWGIFMWYEIRYLFIWYVFFVLSISISLCCVFLECAQCASIKFWNTIRIAIDLIVTTIPAARHSQTIGLTYK